MTGRWKARKSKTTLSLPFHRPLEISPNTVRFPHSHPTADDKIETLLTDSKKPQLDEKCQPCARSEVSTMSPAAQFGYRPYGPRSYLRSIFEFPHRLLRAGSFSVILVRQAHGRFFGTDRIHRDG